MWEIDNQNRTASKKGWLVFFKKERGGYKSSVITHPPVSQKEIYKQQESAEKAFKKANPRLDMLGNKYGYKEVKKTEHIHVKVTKNEKESIQAQAKEAKKSVSAYILSKLNLE
ncbi:plasmid mobilization protein [Taylorella asinigenitalis]|uniref:plasmid mobilization protein n=1 Tax=Taylorella asinigenitalis TaxID=84590 RepID=UPI0005D26514|nr:hypothetical protein [Taylorella asinigenitalis]